MLNIESRILLPSYGTNTWLLYDDLSQEAILVDPAAPSEELLHRISQLGIQITMIFNTHGHGDHIGGNTWFKERLDAPL
ncbi:MAG: MBL fold metallo-hydrolase, partial [Candidatus Cloacimonadaceae bacterium]